jgi:uncharacterized damage-inducible protein DinB
MKTQALLNKLKSDVEVINDVVKNDFYNLSEEKLNWEENLTRWSILECFEHLNRYSRYYVSAMEKALHVAENPPVNDELKSTWIGAKSISMMHPLNKKKQKTFKNMNPVNSKLDRSVLDEFLKHQEKLQILITKAESTDINRMKIPLEFFRLLKMTLGEALEFLIVHEQRHLIQAQDVRSKISENKSPILAV